MQQNCMISILIIEIMNAKKQKQPLINETFLCKIKIGSLKNENLSGGSADPFLC